MKDFNIDDFKFLGEGKNGKVYLMPNGKVIKTFKKLINCIDEYETLKKVEGNKHFPRVYKCTDTYMIRDYVGGQLLPDYVKSNGLSWQLALNLIKLIESFQELGFTRLDMRCKHIFVQDNEEIIVIDPRKHYIKKEKYPRQLTEGLKELGVLSKFVHVLKKERPELYNNWKRYI